MKIGILKYPGGHGYLELKYIFQKYYNSEIIDVWHESEFNRDIDLIILPAGFPCRQNESGSYCFEESPILEFLRNFAAEGKYVVGLGSGFRMLCEAGLLPGRLLINQSHKFVCKYVDLKSENNDTLLTSGMNVESVYRMPISSLYGRFDASEEELINMRMDRQILFRFCDYKGVISEAVNYTGSVDNIAAVCNRNKNVFGMLPLPERSVIELMGQADGSKIFEALLKKLR